jgi:hypothetical protein
MGLDRAEHKKKPKNEIYRKTNSLFYGIRLYTGARYLYG